MGSKFGWLPTQNGWIPLSVIKMKWLIFTSSNIIKLTFDVFKLLNVTITVFWHSTSQINKSEGDGTGTTDTINREYSYLLVRRVHNYSGLTQISTTGNCPYYKKMP